VSSSQQACREIPSTAAASAASFGTNAVALMLCVSQQQQDLCAAARVVVSSKSSSRPCAAAVWAATAALLQMLVLDCELLLQPPTYAQQAVPAELLIEKQLQCCKEQPQQLQGSWIGLQA
jgi:hypothetical protein